MNKINLLVFIASLLQLLSPAISTLINNGSEFRNNNPMITPAGYAFIVWGVITILSFAYGIYQLQSTRQNHQLHLAIGLNLIGVYVLFTIWLIAAAQNWLGMTVIVFLVMFYLLSLVFQELLKNQEILTTTEKIILLGQIAIYTGWTTVAIFANFASMLTYYGFSDQGTFGLIWQSAILIAALCNGVFWTGKFEVNPIYVLTIIWAFVGVLVGLSRFENVFALKIITVFAILTMVFYLLKVDKWLLHLANR